MKRYSTIFTEKYVPDWSTADGIREFIANALDSDAPFEYNLEDGLLELTSLGVKLSPKCLTLGTSGNRNNPNAVGTHGEGMVVGLVPIIRDGGEVVIHNGDVIWTPKFEYDEDLEIEVLYIYETEATHNRDYTVSINASKEHIQEAVNKCLYTRDDLGIILESKRGRVFDGFAGELYVGGLFVTKIADPKYSYDFKPEYLPLNRDRKTVESWECAKQTAILLSEVLSAKEVAELVRSKSSSVSNIKYRESVNTIRTECFNMFIEDHGEDAVAVEYHHDKVDLEKKGYTNVIVVGDDNYRAMITDSTEYKGHLSSVEESLGLDDEDDRSPTEIMQEWFDNCAGDLDKYQIMLDLFNKRGVRFSEQRGHSKEDIPF